MPRQSRSLTFYARTFLLLDRREYRHLMMNSSLHEVASPQKPLVDDAPAHFVSSITARTRCCGECRLLGNPPDYPPGELLHSPIQGSVLPTQRHVRRFCGGIHAEVTDNILANQ